MLLEAFSMINVAGASSLEGASQLGGCDWHRCTCVYAGCITAALPE